MQNDDKHKAYQQAHAEIKAVLLGEQLAHLKMATINSILKAHLPYYFWVGFYLKRQGKDELSIGAYQGTLGCLHIPFTKGVCGRAARTQSVQIVADTHADPEHIACDASSLSEIVVPVFDYQQHLIAVLDVDSQQLNSFDEIDAHYLQSILNEQFAASPLEYIY
jgi:L-methionine (R)-S-oxide reductase